MRINIGTVLFWIITIGGGYYAYTHWGASSTQEAATVAATAAVVATTGAVVAATEGVAWWYGGWLLASELSLGMMFLLYTPVVILLIATGTSCEWGDPHFNWRKKDYDPEAESREIITSLLFAGTVLFLEWGGVPIWATIKAASWYDLGWVALYVLLGMSWSAYRWDDLSAYLYHKRKCWYQGIAREICTRLETIQKVKKECANPRLNALEKESYGHRYLNMVIEMRQGLLDETLPEKSELPYERLHLEKWELYEVGDFEDAQLARWITELQPSEGKSFTYPPEFKSVFEREGKDAPQVSWSEHKGQLYLWSAFWPLSLAIRVIHKIVTLRLLKQFFFMIINRLGFAYEYIAKRHEVTIEAVKRETPPPPPPQEMRAEGKEQSDIGDNRKRVTFGHRER